MGPERLKDAAETLLRMHTPGDPVILPTVWDAWSARLAVDAGFGALTVGSHPVADSVGKPDNEGMSFEELLARVTQITSAVEVPVSVDIESGYAQLPARLIDGLPSAGAVGLNIEDTVHSEGGRLRSAGEHAELVDALRAAAAAAGVHVVINARTDLFLRADGDEADRVVARQLVAVSEADTLVCFHVYPVGSPEPIQRAFAEYDRALAERKAKVNVIGLVGLVENMPDGDAIRPGDILKSASGQTIEVQNTDAEGRLVLCDVLWYAQEHFKPKAMVDLATLTGAIVISLGHHHAGLFTESDDLANELSKAGQTEGERVWRLPLGPEYDSLLKSKFADMRNIGGRAAGSITAAQFLKRFVKEGVKWAHLDIAGVAWVEGEKAAFDVSWASGFGPRLLDRWIADNYEN